MDFRDFDQQTKYVFWSVSGVGNVHIVVKCDMNNYMDRYAPKDHHGGTVLVRGGRF